MVQMRYLGDPSATFTKALELDFDGTAIFGGPRSKRYALVIEEGKVKSVHVEPDAIGTNGKVKYFITIDSVKGKNTDATYSFDGRKSAGIMC